VDRPAGTGSDTARGSSTANAFVAALLLQHVARLGGGLVTGLDHGEALEGGPGGHEDAAGEGEAPATASS